MGISLEMNTCHNVWIWISKEEADTIASQNRVNALVSGVNDLSQDELNSFNQWYVGYSNNDNENERQKHEETIDDTENTIQKTPTSTLTSM